MAPPDITVTVEDEGYFKRQYSLPINANLKRLMDRYRAHVCLQCSDPRLLDFWYESTKISDGHTSKTLGIRQGDIIDVRVVERCTRGACPLPTGQTLPNIHYLNNTAAPPPQAGQIREEEHQLPPPKRITMIVRDINGMEMVFTTRVDSEFRYVMRTFAAELRREMDTCRFLLDGQRIQPEQTPENVDMEDGDVIDVQHEVRGGGCAVIGGRKHHLG